MRRFFLGVRVWGVLAALVSVTFIPKSVPADEVPATTKVKVLLTALSFDRSLKEHAEGGIVVGVLGTCETSEALLGAAGKAISGMPIAIQALGAVEGAEALSQIIKKHRVDVLFVCSASNLGVVAAVAAKEKVITLAEKVEWVEDKLVLGVGDKEGRPELVLNMNAAKDAGAEFDPRIFGVARVVE